MREADGPTEWIFLILLAAAVFLCFTARYFGLFLEENKSGSWASLSCQVTIFKSEQGAAEL